MLRKYPVPVILRLIAKAQEYGDIKILVNGAGVSPSQAPIEAILRVDPGYPSLQTHEIESLSRRYGMKVWQSYL